PVVSDRKISVIDTVPAMTLPELKSGKERGKVIVVDALGMNRRVFNAGFIEFCKTPGNELWLVEPIYDDADVLDAFLGYADKIIFPYTDIRRDAVLKDILEISDNCIPLLVCSKRTCNGKDPVDLVRMLSETGFHNIMVADMDGSVSPETWENMLDECGGLISYSPFRTIETECHILAKDLFPLRHE
ncbi:MAG: hypothetical protein MJZ21_06295, partial [archaeon]|nr:hypothetical protein [archaeon]